MYDKYEKRDYYGEEKKEELVSGKSFLVAIFVVVCIVVTIVILNNNYDSDDLGSKGNVSGSQSVMPSKCTKMNCPDYAVTANAPYCSLHGCSLCGQKQVKLGYCAYHYEAIIEKLGTY